MTKSAGNWNGKLHFLSCEFIILFTGTIFKGGSYSNIFETKNISKTNHALVQLSGKSFFYKTLCKLSKCQSFFSRFSPILAEYRDLGIIAKFSFYYEVNLSELSLSEFEIVKKPIQRKFSIRINSVFGHFSRSARCTKNEVFH